MLNMDMCLVEILLKNLLGNIYSAFYFIVICTPALADLNPVHRCESGAEIQLSKGPDWGGASSTALIIKAFKEPTRDRKKQKNIKHSRNITFDETVNIAWQMQHWSLARGLSGTIKKILGTTQSVVCNVDGCHPLDINSGIVECSAS